MRIAVFGTGAVGGYFGGRLAQAGEDVVSGLPSELEEQTGAVVRLGRTVGVDTPVNDFIYSSLIPMERCARRQVQPST